MVKAALSPEAADALFRAHMVLLRRRAQRLAHARLQQSGIEDADDLVHTTASTSNDGETVCVQSVNEA